MGRCGLARTAALAALLTTAPMTAFAQGVIPQVSDREAAPSMPPRPPMQPVNTAPAQGPRPSSAGLIPTVRLAFGSDVGTAGSGTDAGFAFDAALGLAYISRMNDAGVWIWPELGYASDGRDGGGGSYFTAGASLLFGTGMLAGGVSSRFLAGDTRDQLGLGVRTSAMVQLGYTLLTLEAGHQWVTTDANDRGEFRVTLAINPLMILGGIALLVAPGAVLRGGFNLLMGH